MFDAVPITVFSVSVIESVSVECRLQPRCGTDEKECVIDEKFLADFSKDHSKIARLVLDPYLNTTPAQAKVLSCCEKQQGPMKFSSSKSSRITADGLSDSKLA